MLEAGLSIGEVHRRTGRAKSSIYQLTKKVETMGAERAVKTSPGCGKKVLVSLQDIKIIIKHVKKEPFISAKKIKEKMKNRGKKFSPRYIRKVLQRAGYSGKHAAKKSLLTENDDA